MTFTKNLRALQIRQGLSMHSWEDFPLRESRINSMAGRSVFRLWLDFENGTGYGWFAEPGDRSESPLKRNGRRHRSRTNCLPCPLSVLSSQENVSRHECGKYYGDYSVHREKGGVEFGEIVGPDQRMFVQQQQGDGDYSGNSELA